MLNKNKNQPAGRSIETHPHTEETETMFLITASINGFNAYEVTSEGNIITLQWTALGGTKATAKEAAEEIRKVSPTTTHIEIDSYIPEAIQLSSIANEAPQWMETTSKGEG